MSAQASQITGIPVTGLGVFFAVSPDSRMIAVTENSNLHNDNEVEFQYLPIRLYDINTGENVGTLNGHTDYAGNLAFSPDGKALASFHGNGYVYIWDIETRSLKSSFIVGMPMPRRVIQFLPDGEHLVISNNDITPIPALSIWDIESGSMVRLLMPHFDSYQQFNEQALSADVALDSVVTLAVSPDGSHIAAATVKENVWLWNVASGDGQRIHPGDDRPYLSIRDLQFTDDSRRLLFYDRRAGTLRIWDIEANAELAPIPLDAQVVAIAPSGQMVAWVTDKADSVFVQDIPGDNPITEIPVDSGIPPAPQLAFTPDGANLILNGGMLEPDEGFIGVIHMP